MIETQINKPALNNLQGWKRHAEELLSLITKNSLIDDNQWTLITAQGDLDLDFTKFSKRMDAAKVSHQICVDYYLPRFKLIFLESVVGFKNKNLIRSVFFGIFKTLYFLALNNKQRIHHEDLSDYYEFILERAISNGDLVKSIRPIYLHRSAHDLCRWNRILHSFNFDGLLFETIEHKHLNVALRRAIPRLTENSLSYSDWQAGMGLNTLTLEFGSYYVDHCARFFEEHIELAIIISRVIEQVFELCKSVFPTLGYTTYTADYRPIIYQTLNGQNLNSFHRARANNGLSNPRLKKIYEITVSAFHAEALARAFVTFLGLKKAKQIISAHFNVELSVDEFHILRDVLITYYDSENLPMEIKNRLLEVFDNNISFNEIVKCVEQYSRVECSNTRIPKHIFFEDIKCVSSSKRYKNYISDFLEKVRLSGQVIALAFTGWRGSELGYSINDIAVELNKDILDSRQNPIRFVVNGFIPKTHGETQVSREITSSVYNLSLKMAALNSASNQSPCLLKVASSSHNNAMSIAEQYKRHSGQMWSHFVLYYPPFLKIAELKKKQKNSESDIGHRKLSSLERAFNRVTQEYELSSIATSKRSNLVKALRNKSLSKPTIELIHSRIPQRTIDAAFDKSLDKESLDFSLKRLSIEINRTILKPTPHAFRHMWAEAVYRRFDGDVGWAIRSNFKHISQDMWLAYIKDKDHQNMHQQVKSQVISSLLKNYVDKDGEGYAGAIDTVMRRLVSKTKITDSSMLSYHVEAYAEREIESIKSTPWGFCLLRSRVRSKAKCAVDGVPQRSSASPALCLGCTNNLAMTSSIEGILLSTSNDLKLLEANEASLPKLFKKASQTTVKLALKYLIKLKADDNIINTYKNALLK